ncbi:MAG TPA: TonB-dependent receptor [Burkholderiaceae bacterium]
MLLSLAALIAGADLAPAAPALADDAAAVSDLGAVVVHARRRDERLTDAPVAVTVETGEQLQQQNAVLFEDIARDVPNLRMMQSPRSVSALEVTMRGQTAISSAIVYDPAVGIYVDGVYVANGQAAMATLLDIDSVEIVRGAQGTLFGRNNTGGSISFRTNRPQLGAFGADAAAAAGADHLFMGRGVVNVPVGDTLAFRFAYQDNERDGYGTSTGSGQDNFGNQHRYQARLGALWRPSAAFDAYWTFEHLEADEVGALLHPLHGTQAELIGQALPLVGLPPASVPDNFYQTNADFPSHDRTRLDATQLTLTQAVGDAMAAKLILGYRHLHNDTAIDIDAMNMPLANSNLINSSNQKSAEFQLSGSAIDRHLDWVAGLYWFRDDGSAGSVLQPPSAPFEALINPQFPNLPPQLQAVLLSPAIEVNAAQNESAAGFVHGEYHLSDRWSAAAGVRRTDDTRKLSENTYADTPFGQSCAILDASTGLPANGGGPCPPIDKQVRFSYWSYELSTRYRFTDTLNGYLRTGRAQRSGGWNAPVNTLQDEPFKPEQLTDYEIGLKADLLGGALLIDGDVFYGRYDQMQRLIARLIQNTPTTFVINAGRARVSGAELETSWRVSQPMSLQAAFGFTQARYREFTYQPDPTSPATVNLATNDFYQTPRFTASLGASYDWRLDSGSVRLHADYAWQDHIQFNVINDFNTQGSYGTLNARAAYASSDATWDAALFGTNLTGRHYAATGGTVGANPLVPGPPPISWQIPAPPRLYGIEVGYHFGNRR